MISFNDAHTFILFCYEYHDEIREQTFILQQRRRVCNIFVIFPSFAHTKNKSKCR